MRINWEMSFCFVMFFDIPDHFFLEHSIPHKRPKCGPVKDGVIFFSKRLLLKKLTFNFNFVHHYIAFCRFVL